MNCRRVSNLISAYMDGELTGVEMLEIRRHLDDCGQCALQYESLRYTKQLLSKLRYAEPRAGLVSTICARLDNKETPSYQKIWNLVLSYGHLHLTPVAASCAALGGLFIFLSFYTAKVPDIVALHNHPAYSGSGSVQESTLTPVAFFSNHRNDARALIPALPEDTIGGSAMFTLVSSVR